MRYEDRKQPALGGGGGWRGRGRGPPAGGVLTGKLSDSLLGIGAPSLQVLSLFTLCPQLNRNSALCPVRAGGE